MIRTVSILAVLAACGGGSSTPDAHVVDSKRVDAPPDADTSAHGTWIDTYYANAGTITESKCGAAPFAVVVDETTGASTAYPGTCHGDGSFALDTPPSLTGNYDVRAAGALYETSAKSGLELGTDHLGRNDIAAISGVDLMLNMNGLASWATGDLLMAFASNIGFYQSLSFTSGGPGSGATSVSGTSPWLGYKVDSAKSDTLQVVQLGTHTSPSPDFVPYLTLDRTFTAPAFTMANATAAYLTGTFITPSPLTLPLVIDAGSFDAYATAGSPNTTTRAISATAFAAPSPQVVPSPPLFSFSKDSSGTSILDFGTVSYGDPYPSAWKRYVRIQESFLVPFTWNSVPGSLNAQMVRMMPKASATGTIAADLSPPTAPKLDGVDAYTVSNITAVPVVSWSPPALGTPTDYEVQVYDVQQNGSLLKFVAVVRIVTEKTSLRIPDGYLLGQRQYVFVIRARKRTGIDPTKKLLALPDSWSSADVITNLVTTS